jgi:hypothetical protein
MKKFKLMLLMIVAIEMLSSCKKDDYHLSNLEFKVYDIYQPAQKVEKLDRIINLQSREEVTLYLEVNGILGNQVLKVWYEMYTLQGTYIDRINVENITRKNLVIPITFRDIGKGDYKVRIYARSDKMDAPLLILFDVRVHDKDQESGDSSDISFYVNGGIAPPTIYLYPSTKNIYLEVKTDIPNHTLVYYKWNDEVYYRTEVIRSNKAYIVMPYLKDKTRILDVWLNGYASKRFTVISQ